MWRQSSRRWNTTDTYMWVLCGDFLLKNEIRKRMGENDFKVEKLDTYFLGQVTKVNVNGGESC